MAHLPPSGWGDVARTRDLEDLATRSELDALGTELRAAIDGLRAETRADLADLRGEMHGLETRLTRQMAEQTRTVVFAQIGTLIGFGGLAIATFKLL